MSINLGDIDTSAITDMSYLFDDTKRTDFSGISGWNVSKVKNMNGMFMYMDTFNEPLDKWDISSAKYMYRMFNYASSFDQDLSGWDIGNAYDTQYIIREAKIKIQENKSKYPKGLSLVDLY